MATRRLPRVAYDGELMTKDAAGKGWGPRELAAKSRGKVSQRTVYRFLSNEVQTVTTAGILASLLKHPVDRYVLDDRSGQERRTGVDRREARI